MKSFIALSFVCFLSTNTTIKAQDNLKNERQAWLSKAEESKPILKETIRHPLHFVNLVKDTSAFQGWRTVAANYIDTLHESSFKASGNVIVDFGEHLTGYFTFTISFVKGLPEAPVRLKFTFAEVPGELAVPFDPYPGSLSRAWLQDETVTAVVLPSTITIPRRLAFRYVKIEVTGSCSFCDFSVYDLQCKATTSVNNNAAALAAGTSSIITKIDSVGLKTLKECMQTVYEDGPKRDRRLWIGDLYLESLANTYSFKNHNLTRRCLYLLAALSREEDGFLNSNVLEIPYPHPQDDPFLFDYSLLYNVALKEYFIAAKDSITALDLWSVAKKQVESPLLYLRQNGIFDYKAASKAGWWLFVDWKQDLDKEASIQGIIIFSLKQTYELAKLLGKEKEVAHLPRLISTMTVAARKNLYNKHSGLFESGADKQISYASQAWMILSGVATKSEAQRALRALPQIKNAIYPGTPYLNHYYIEAMIECGMQKEAKESLIKYWGGMIKKGADTFWEAYDPTNDFLSPYNFYPINSYCHAWSCTPVYFIRKYPEIFQGL